MLGKAIKELKLPREELVIFTKVGVHYASPGSLTDRETGIFSGRAVVRREPARSSRTPWNHQSEGSEPQGMTDAFARGWLAYTGLILCANAV